MSIQRHRTTHRRLEASEISWWKDIPSAVASDAQQRTRTMERGITPISAGTKVFGQARTVEAISCDSSAIHAAVSIAEPGEVLVCNAEGHPDAALVGALTVRAAIKRGLAGIIIDGAVRDSVEIAELGFPVFCRTRVARGTRRSEGGVLDGAIVCGGVVVNPGDLVIGDDDGVTVVRLQDVAHARSDAEAILAEEANIIEMIELGKPLDQIFEIPQIHWIDRNGVAPQYAEAAEKVA